MAGTLTATTIQNDTSSPPTFRNSTVEIGQLCRAWVNFNGTGTVAIRSSFNVSSITDNGTGDYTVNFTTAMPNINYAYNVSSSSTGVAWVYNPQLNNSTGGTLVAPTTSACRFVLLNSNATAYQDNAYINVAVYSS
jgi:hypothetical protein